MPEETKVERINELARELEVKIGAVIAYLPEIGITEKKIHSSSISLVAAEKVRKHFNELAEANNETPRRPLDVAFKSTTARTVDSPRSQLSIAPKISNPFAFLGTQNSSGVTNAGPTTIRLPKKFTFHRAFVDFDYIFGCFDWSLKDVLLRSI